MQLQKLGLSLPQITIQPIATNSTRETRLELSRNIWLSLIEKHPDFGVTQLRDLDTKTYFYLYRNDREWLLKNYPASTMLKTTKNSKRIDWLARDMQYKQSVLDALNKLSDPQVYPCWLSRTAIAREAGILAIYQQHPDKVPQTVECINFYSETLEDFAERRIRWIAKDFRDNGIIPKYWQLVRQANVARYQNNPRIQVVLNEILGSLES